MITTLWLYKTIDSRVTLLSMIKQPILFVFVLIYLTSNATITCYPHNSAAQVLYLQQPSVHGTSPWKWGCFILASTIGLYIELLWFFVRRKKKIKKSVLVTSNLEPISNSCRLQYIWFSQQSCCTPLIAISGQKILETLFTTSLFKAQLLSLLGHWEWILRLLLHTNAQLVKISNMVMHAT